MLRKGEPVSRRVLVWGACVLLASPLAGCSDDATIEPAPGPDGGDGCSYDDPFSLSQCPASYPEFECRVYVDGDVASSGDGWSWDTAVKTVQEGVDRAHCGAVQEGVCAEWTVWVKAGRYPVGRGCRSDSLRLRSRVGVYGGFLGSETSEADRDWAERETILDGSAHDPAAPSYHVIRGADDAVLDGFTVTGGRADHPDEDDQQRGGALFNVSTSPEIRNVRFVDNYASSNGGALYNEDGSLTVTACHFEGNAAGKYGGALNDKDGSTSQIEDSVFVANFAAEGGAIDTVESSTSMRGCTFEANEATHGGGLLTQSGSSTCRAAAGAAAVRPKRIAPSR